jgi:hypothetical protein
LEEKTLIALTPRICGGRDGRLGFQKSCLGDKVAQTDPIDMMYGGLSIAVRNM